jgi:hypothetical protein
MKRAILIGGLLAGLGDISQAFLFFYLAAGATPFRILQSIARGWFGSATFQMGWRSAVIGLASHFFIATAAAAVFVLATRVLAAHGVHVLTRRWLLCGLAYGLVVFGVMYFVVMPLSPVGWPKLPFGWATWVTGPIGHPLLVGLPIAWAAKKWAARRQSLVADR